MLLHTLAAHRLPITGRPLPDVKRHTQLRLTKGTYWDQFMSVVMWLNAVLPVFNPHTLWRRM